MSAPLVGPNHNEIIVKMAVELQKYNFCSVSERRVAVMAERLDAALTGAIQFGDDKPMPSGEWAERCASREAALKASQGDDIPLTDEESRTVEAWRSWMQANASEPEPEIIVRRGQAARPGLDDVVEMLGAAFEELTGRKPFRQNQEAEERGRTVTQRGGDFLAFASRVTASHPMPHGKLLSDARIKAVVALRKRRRLKL